MNATRNRVLAADEHGIPEQAGKWRNQRGHFVDPSMLSQFDIAKEKLLVPMIRKAVEISDMLTGFKQAIFMDWRLFYAEALEDYGCEITTEKGNGTLYTFDQRYKVQMNSSAVQEFDLRIDGAIGLIAECLKDWAQTSDPRYSAVMDELLEKDRKGNISVCKALQLRHKNIDDERWAQAMGIIADAVIEVGRSSYLNFYERVEAAPGRNEWRLIPLSLAKA